MRPQDQALLEATPEPQFYIAMVGELRTPGHENPKTDPRGGCHQINEAFDLISIMRSAISEELSLTFFFTVYVIKPNGEVMAVEDFPNLADARTEWPTAEVRGILPS